MNLINGYRKMGHAVAQLDPLGLRSGADLDDTVPDVRACAVLSGVPDRCVQELTLEHYGFSEADLDKQFSFRQEDNNMPGLFGDGGSC